MHQYGLWFETGSREAQSRFLSWLWPPLGCMSGRQWCMHFRLLQTYRSMTGESIYYHSLYCTLKSDSLYLWAFDPGIPLHCQRSLCQVHIPRSIIWTTIGTGVQVVVTSGRLALDSSGMAYAHSISSCNWSKAKVKPVYCMAQNKCI